MPDIGGPKNGHADAIYGGQLIFAWYSSLPDQPPIEDLQDFVNRLFFGSFEKVGKVFDLNNPVCMRIIDTVFRAVGDRDRKDALKYPDGFITVNEPYDKKHRAARYRFTSCPNAEFAKKHGLMHILPLLCNSDFYGIKALHGTLIRCGTCGNARICDYCIVGDRNSLSDEYTTVTDEGGFLTSRKKEH